MTRIRRTPPDDHAAKRQMIEAYFDDLHARARFADVLYDNDRRDEAITLCCCYIDGLASLLYHDSDRSAFNFVRLLTEHGRRAELARVQPLAMVRGLKTSNKRLAPVARRLEAALGSDVHRIVDAAEFDALMAPHVTPQEASALCRELWRASLAFVAYTHLRIPAVHATGAPGAVIVGSGGPSPPVRIDFRVMYEALLACIEALRDLSLRTNKWFGHDHIV